MRLGTLAGVCAAGLAMASDGSAQPLRKFDPKTGLPQTWDSRIGVLPAPVNGRDPITGKNVPKATNVPGARVDSCHHFDQTACSDPAFTSRCPNAVQACSAIKELAACQASPPAGQTCGQVYYQNHKAQMDAVPSVRRIEPSRSSLATQSTRMHFVPYDRSRVVVGGMDHSFAARLANPALIAAASPVAKPGVRPAHETFLQTAMKKVGASGAGSSANTPIDSCDEYGARKYLSLTQFDAAVNAASRDPRAVYNLVYQNPQYSSIVNRGQVTDSEGQVSTEAPTAAFDSQGNVVELPGGHLSYDGVSHPRNEFAYVATSFGQTFVLDDGKHGPQDFPTQMPALSIATYSGTPVVGNAIANWEKSNDIFFNQELFGRRTFPASDSPMISETFAWHKAKNDALWEDASVDQPGRYTDEELQVRYARMHQLSTLMARRSQIASFIGNVSDYCRIPTPPAPITPKDTGTLTRQIAQLTAFVTALKSQGQAVFQSPQYITDYDPVLTATGVSHSWVISDPIMGTTKVMSPTLTGPSWGIRWAGGDPDNYATWSPGDCKSQTGCPAWPVAISFGEVAGKITELTTQVGNNADYNASIPAMNAAATTAYQQSILEANATCKGFGIDHMFANKGGPPVGSMTLTMPTPLSPAEAQVVANAFSTNVLPKLGAVDALIAEQLGAGIELSCFDRSQNGCDWSANRLIDYIHAYRKSVDKQREADVARCESFTTHVGGKFTLKQQLADLMRSKNFNWDQYRKTVKGFEQGLEVAQAEELKQLLDMVEAATEMQVYDEDGKTPALGKVTDTDGSFGGDMFGASYGAGGGYRFGNLSTNAQGTAYSGDDKTATADNFTYWSGDYAFASVMILGTTNEVFNARMDIALTDGHVLDLQQAKGSPDQPYLTGGDSGGRNYLGESGGIEDKFSKAYAAAKPEDKNRLVEGHLHFRVVGDDLFSPINQVVTPTVYASNEPIYSFEPAEFDTTLFDDSTTVVIVFVPVTIRGWATFQAGITYSIDASLDRANVDSAVIPVGQKLKDRKPFQLVNQIEPYAEIDGNVSVAVGIPGLEVGLKGSLELIRLGLPYQTSANVTFFDGGASSATQSSGTRFHANQSLDLTLSTLSGQVDGFVEVLFWEADQELFGWNGISSTTPIFDLNEIDANVHQASKAVRMLRAANYQIGQ